jgi:cell division protein FtsB
MNRIILYGIIIAAVIGYFIYTQTRMQSLVEDKANLTTSLQASEGNMKNYKESIAKQQKLLGEASAAKAAAEQQAREALKAMEDNDLGYLSEQKPELIEKAINRGTKNVFKQIEEATAPPAATAP